MKNVAFVVVALGILLATAASSLAGDSWGGHGDRHRAPVHHPYHPGYSASYYGGYRPVIVAPTQCYGYPSYSPVIGPVYSPVVPYPYYRSYYGAPGVSFGYRGPGVAIGVGF